MVFEKVRWTYSEVQLWGKLAHWQILISVLDVISWSPNSTDLYFWYVFVKRQIQKTWQGNLLGYHWLVCIAVLIRLWAVACYFNPSQDLFPSRSTTIYGGATSAAQKIVKVRDYSPSSFCGIFCWVFEFHKYKSQSLLLKFRQIFLLFHHTKNMMTQSRSSNSYRLVSAMFIIIYLELY